MSKKFRKTPIAIEAWQTATSKDDVLEDMPPWLVEAIRSGFIYNDGQEIRIKTLEGDMTVSPGDWIVRGIQGEIYPCKPDIFAATYEEVVNG